MSTETLQIKRTPIENPPKHKGQVYTRKEIKALIELLCPLCAGFGIAYASQKVCRLCPASVLCMAARSQGANIKIKKFKETKCHAKYFLDEYQKEIEIPGRFLELQTPFLKAIVAKAGKWVKFKNIDAILRDTESPYYFKDFMKTEIETFPQTFFDTLGHFEGMEIDRTKNRIRYVKNNNSLSAK